MQAFLRSVILTFVAVTLLALPIGSAFATVCGDGFTDPGELCDDGNFVSGDGCDANCLPTGCGNGVTTLGEQCDDGNLIDGDGCSEDCERELLDPVPAAGDHFGRAVAAVGTNVLVGAPQFDVTNAINTGVAHLFSAATGALLRSFANPTPGPGDEFGAAVAGLGANVLVAAPFDDTAGPNAGAVYLFDGVSGALIRTFLNPSPGANDHFGAALAIVGSNLVVGAPEDSTGVGGGGVAYLINAVTGAVLQVFLNPSPSAGDNFGSAIAAVGGNVLIGAPNSDLPSLSNAGEAYLCDAATGALIRTFANPAPAVGDLFGAAVAAVGSQVVIGAPHTDTVTAAAAAVYLYDPSNGILLRTFTSPSPGLNDAFGFALTAVGDDRVAVGARLDDVAALNSGAVFLFHAATGSLLGEFKKPLPAAEDHLGESLVALDGRLWVGAPLDDTVAIDAGAVYAFADRSCGNGTTEGGESCDDGNATDGDGCDRNCTVTGCGNGIVTAGESCDDGNLAAADGCSSSCTLEGACGDGTVGPGEVCDDANLVSGDGCDANCTPTGCGNGSVTAGEQCDEGAANGLDLCCSATCVAIDSDADGICDGLDVCPPVSDPVQANGDGDVYGDACDICPSDTNNDSDGDGFCRGSTFRPPAIGGGDPCSRGAAGVWTKPRLKIAGLNKPLGSQTLKISGSFTVGSSFPVLAPQMHGVQLRIVGADGTLLVDEQVPGSVLAPGGIRGWKTSGSPPSKWTFVDRGKPPLYNGIAKVVVKDLSHVSPGRVSVQVSGKFGSYALAPPSQSPLRMTVELNDTAFLPGGTPGRDQCGEQPFFLPPGRPGCTSKPTSLDCK